MFETLATNLVTLSEPSSGGGAIVTADMLQPLVDGITSNVAVILPVCLGIMAIMVGIGLIPRLIKRFKDAG